MDRRNTMAAKKKFTRTDSSLMPNRGNGSPTPNIPLRSSEHPWEPWGEGSRFAGLEVPLGRLGGGTEVGVNLMKLPAGKQSCPYHWHLREEEHFYVLEGCCVLRSGEQRYEMTAGDYVCFPAGTEVAHSFENPFSQACLILAIGTRVEDEIAVYPDSGKAKLRAMGAIVPYPFTSLDYWKDEPVDEPVREP